MIKRRMNCEGDRATRYPVYEFDGDKFYSCPRRTLTSDTARILSLYRHYESGYLLGSGALGDQSALYCSFMDITAAAFSREESALMEERNKEMQRQAQRSVAVQRLGK